jgi:hypothetical protein
MNNDGLSEFAISPSAAKKMIALNKFVNVMSNFAIVIYDEVMASEGNDCQKELFKYIFGYDECVFDRMEALFTTFFYKLLRLKDEAEKNGEFIAIPFLDFDMLPISEFTFKKDSLLFEVIYQNVLLDHKLTHNQVPIFLDLLCQNFSDYKDADSNLELSKVRLLGNLKSQRSLQIPIPCELPLDDKLLRKAEFIYKEDNLDKLGIISSKLIDAEIKESLKAHDEFLDDKTMLIHEAVNNFYSEQKALEKALGLNIKSAKFTDFDVEHNDYNEDSNPETDCFRFRDKDKDKVALYHINALLNSIDERSLDTCEESDGLTSAVLSPTSYIVESLIENMLVADRNSSLGRLKVAIQTFESEF